MQKPPVTSSNKKKGKNSMEKEDLKLVAWILRGSMRREVLMQLEHKPKTPSLIQESPRITNKTELNSRSGISDTLRSFREYELVEVLNPEAHKIRFYQLTPKGKNILKEVKSYFEED